MSSPEKMTFRLAIAVALCAGVAGCTRNSPVQEFSADSREPRTVYALGRLEPASGVIDIRATPGDRLQMLEDEIRENALAPTDGILGTLDSYDMGKAQLIALLKKRALAEQKHIHQKQLAAAQLARARATVAEATAKQDELALRAKRLTVLREARDLAKIEFDSLERLRRTDSELITDHQLEKKRNQTELASQDYEIAFGTHAAATTAAIAGKAAAVAALAVAKVTNVQAQKAFETELVDQEIAVAREALKRSVLLAPNFSKQALRRFVGVDLKKSRPSATLPVERDDQRATNDAPHYTVLRIFVRPGEAVAQLPVMQIGDLRKMICIAEVYEADVQELFLDQQVTIRSPAFSGNYADGKLDSTTNRRTGGIRGKVVHIGRMIAPPGLKNRNPLAPADRSVVEVRIEIDLEANNAAIAEAGKKKPLEDANAHAAKNVGLQVTVEFNKRPPRGIDGNATQ